MCEWCIKHQGIFWEEVDTDEDDWQGKWAMYEVYCPMCGHRGCHVMPEFMEPWDCPDCGYSPLVFGEGVLEETRSN